MSRIGFYLYIDEIIMDRVLAAYPHQNHHFHQVFVYGESIKSTLVAIVILDEESLRVDCPPQFSHLLHLHTSEEFNNFVLSAMRKLGSTELNSIEQVYKSIVIHLLAKLLLPVIFVTVNTIP